MDRLRTARALALIVLAASVAVATLAAISPAAQAAAGPARPAPGVRVGVGRADITPVTGVFKGGWSCTCAKAIGQQERLYARAVVIQEGDQKVALVTEDLFALSAGMVRDAASLLSGYGFSEANIIDSATHTHSSQSGYMNFSSYNSILPSNSNPTLTGVTNTAANPAMYDFMTRELALAILRAYRDRRPGAIGWGQTDLLGITQNRSLGAHLANYGLSEGANGGTVSQDPGGYPDTIDPTVDVLRLDQYRRVRGTSRTRRVPVGIYSTFANHGTVDHENFWYYSADHQGAAERVVEAAIRRAGHVSGSQDVINAFANSDAGDMTSGIQYNGPADAEYVGRREAAAMLAAWRQAGHAMTRRPQFGLRFTRVCMCGQETIDGPIDSTPWIGKAAGAGSEEGRTIFYYDGAANEGDKLPVAVGPQGDKILALNEKGSVPQGVPFYALRLGSRLIATVPGEPTVGTGTLIRSAVQDAVAGTGVKQVVIVGYAGDYLSYFTTPAEYEQQAYEGGFTLFGRYSSLVLQSTLADLAQRLVDGRPAPAPYPYDPNEGVHLSTASYGSGAVTAAASAQPAATARLGHTSFAWSGGPDGIDRPVGLPFVTIQRAAGRRWRSVANDLGMQILWSADASGHYLARWEVPLSSAAGRYRFRVTGKRYVLASSPFQVGVGSILTPTLTGATVELAYPQPFLLNDWTYRPRAAAGGRVTFVVDGRRRTVREHAASRFPVPAGTSVTIPARGARDRYGNTNPSAVQVR
jgi:neutral ceramidase